MFQNVDEAVEILIDKLPKLDKSWFIISISKKGDKIAEIIAKKFNLNFDRLFLQSVPCPQNIDCQVAVISEFEDILFNEPIKESFKITSSSLIETIRVIYDYKLKQDRKTYRGQNRNLQIPQYISKVILVDNQIETGFFMELSLESMKRFNLDNIIVASLIIPEYIEPLFMNKPNIKLIYSKKVEFYTEFDDYFMELTK